MTKKEKIIVICGEFDPLSFQELKFIKRCKSKGDWLIVGIHTDWWMEWCKGSLSYNYETRRDVVDSIKHVDEIMTFSDMDGTVCQLLKLVKICYPDAQITFVSNTDMKDMPETKIRGITFEIIK